VKLEQCFEVMISLWVLKGIGVFKYGDVKRLNGTELQRLMELIPFDYVNRAFDSRSLFRC